MRRKTSLKRFQSSKVLRSYWEENGYRCEVIPHLPTQELGEVSRKRKTNSEYLELHHILRQPNYRVDNWSNSIIISSIVHDMTHGEYQNEITVACLFAKYRKAEFIISELNQAGPKPIRDVVSILRKRLLHRREYVDMCDRMLATIP